MTRKSVRLLTIFSIFLLLNFSIFFHPSLSQPKKTFLWKVQSNTNTVYVVGSIHYLKSQMYPLDEKIEKAFDQSDVLVVEANVGDPNKVNIQKLFESALYLDNETLEKHVSPGTYEMVKKELEGLGIPLDLASKQKPWFLALTLVSLEIGKLGFDPNYGIDKYFLSKSTGNKKILELESFDYQTHLLATLPEKDQELFLVYTLKDIKVLKEELDKLIQTWTSGDENRMESIVTKSVKEDERLVPIYEKLIYERNRNMASKIEDYLKTNETYFVIVGAGHLVGKQGIVEMLRGKGFIVEQL